MKIILAIFTAVAWLSVSIFASEKKTANELLFIGIEKRSTAAVSEAVLSGADVNGARDANGRSALLAAVSAQSVDVFQHLLILGADPNLPAGRDGNSVLGTLVHPNSDEYLQLYIKFGGEINTMIVDLLGEVRPYLSFAASRNRVDLCHIALGAGADVRKLDARGRTALMNAVDRDRFRTAYQLLRWGAIVPEIDLTPERVEEMIRKADAEKVYEPYWTVAFIGELKRQVKAPK
jgi:ankyrin repeat protein